MSRLFSAVVCALALSACGGEDLKAGAGQAGVGDDPDVHDSGAGGGGEVGLHLPGSRAGHGHEAKGVQQQQRQHRQQ